MRAIRGRRVHAFVASCAALGVVVSSVLGLAACSNGMSGSGSSSSDSSTAIPRVVGFAGVGDGEGAWRAQAERRTVNDIEATTGLRVDYEVPDNNSAPSQSDIVRGFISEGVTVIILSPIRAHDWTDVMNAAASSGIPVILLDQRILPDSQYLFTAHIGPDYVAIGRAAGQWARERNGSLVDSRPGADSSNVLIFEAGASSSATSDMTSGFESAAGDSPLQISTLVGSWDMAYAREQMMTTVQELARNKQLPGFIFAQSDSLADIAADSLKSVGAAVCPSDSGSDSDLRKDTAALQTDCTAIISVGASSGNENDTNSGEISKEFSIDSNYVDGVTPLIEKILHGESVSKDTAARVDGVTQ